MDEGSASESAQQVFPCPQCGRPLALGTLACPYCGGLVYRDRLRQLADEALRLEPSYPAQAAMAWRQALDLLPPDSQQYVMISQRIGALAAGFPVPAGPEGAPGGPVPLGYQARSQRAAQDPWPKALAKTGGSMVISILVYGAMFRGPGMSVRESFLFAFGFVLLMLVHEMGHVVTMWYYGLSASPPIFIPFVGALINLRENPPNAKVEAIVGIGGPIAGTIGAVICYELFRFVPALHTPLMLELAIFGFFLNLFNLLPVPPLDGGRITAAISPWVWIVGLVGLVALIVRDFRQNSFGIWILVLILFYALPRIRYTLSARGRDNPYYHISRLSSWTIGILYVCLAGGLVYLMWVTRGFRLLF